MSSFIFCSLLGLIQRWAIISKSQMKNVKKLWHREQMKNEAKEKKEVGCRCARVEERTTFHFQKRETVLLLFQPLQKSFCLFFICVIV